MNVLIVENEVYLARSIAVKLTDLGYECTIGSTLKEASKEGVYDVVLLSTSTLGTSIIPIIKRHCNSIVILMVNYISNDSVANPIKAGADDYIQKPFMIEELIRKIEHYKEFKQLKRKNATYDAYLKHIFENLPDFALEKKITFPIFIKTNEQRFADSYVFKLANHLMQNFDTISLSNDNYISQINKIKNYDILYLVNLQHVKKSEKNKIIELIKDKNVIISSTDFADEMPFFTINMSLENDTFHSNDIYSIENYVKSIILNFQNKLPDTELSKKLGISRKSLWERRKKYGIIKEK